MAFIDYDFYLGEYIGKPIPVEEFAVFCERACDIIDGITSGKASAAAKKADKKSIAAKKAACAQTEMLYTLGDSKYLGNDGRYISREDIGSASVSYRKNDTVTYLGIPISGLAIMYLSSEGLIQRSV